MLRPLRLRARLGWTIGRILGAMPRRWLLTLGDALGTVLALLDRRGREVALENLRLAFGEGLSRAAGLEMHVDSRRIQARVLLLDLAAPPPVRLPSEAVCVTGRLGHWRRLRARGGCLLVEDEPRRGRDGGWVPFLGLPAWTSLRASRRARSRGVPLHPVLLVPDERGDAAAWVGPDLGGEAPEGDVEVAARASLVLERVIRARPDLWDWSYPRFRRRPTPALGRHPRYSRWVPPRP
jgi:lauroyl/myristoyl acyltransferase